MKILRRHHLSVSYQALQTSETELRSECDSMKEKTCSRTSSGKEDENGRWVFCVGKSGFIVVDLEFFFYFEERERWDLSQK